jgi:AcrR family transcriptional regulator
MIPSMATVERPLRRDAERNRARILESARELFAERGLAVTLDDIARHAGLGVGTVYRRFSSRDALIDALFEERMVEIVALVDEALADEDPWRGLVGFLERLVALQAGDRGLKEALLGTTEGRERVRRVREQMRPRGEELIRRAHAAGALRPDFDAVDLALLQLMVGAVADVAPSDRPDLWRRYLTLMLDGLRATPDARGELSEPPLGFDELDEVMCHWRPARWRP